MTWTEILPYAGLLVGTLGPSATWYGTRFQIAKARREDETRRQEIAQSKSTLDQTIAEDLRDELREELNRRDLLHERDLKAQEERARVQMAEMETRHREEMSRMEGRHKYELEKMEARCKEELAAAENRILAVTKERDEIQAASAVQFERFSDLTMSQKETQHEIKALREQISGLDRRAEHNAINRKIVEGGGV